MQKTNTNTITLAFFNFVSQAVNPQSPLKRRKIPALLRTFLEGDRRTTNRSTESADDQAFLAFKCTIFQGINFCSSFPSTKYETPSEGFGS